MKNLKEYLLPHKESFENTIKKLNRNIDTLCKNIKTIV